MVTDPPPDGSGHEPPATPSTRLRAALLQALAHPLRIKILTAMLAVERRRAASLPAPQALSPTLLSILLETGLGITSYHVSVLVEQQLLTLKGVMQRRGSLERFYELHHELPTLLPDLFTLLAPWALDLLDELAGAQPGADIEARWGAAVVRHAGHDDYIQLNPPENDP